MTKKYELALKFAKRAHKGQLRKNTKTEYITHPIAVGEMAASYLKPSPAKEDARIIGVLHDTVEDDPTTTLEMVAEEFGRNIAMHIYFLTDPPKYTGNRRERKEEVCRKMMVAPVLARLVKCCDVMNNLSDVSTLDDDFREIYIQEKVQLYAALCVFRDENLELKAAIDDLGKLIRKLTEPEELADLTAFNPK